MNPNIEKAANLLDERRPGWYNKIDLDRLNMGDVKSCILGQLYSDYFIGKNALNIRDDDLIDAFCKYTEEWQDYIRRRRTDDLVDEMSNSVFSTFQRNQPMNTYDIFRRNAESSLGISQQSTPAGFDKIIHRLGKSIVINRADSDIEHIMSLCKTFTSLANDGRRVQSIKMLRTLTNCDLREAKDFIEYCQEML